MGIKRVEISREVRDILAQAIVEGERERPVLKLPEGKIERDLYLKVDKVLKALGGKWDRRAGGFLFAKPFEVELAEALAEGGVVDQKRTNEQFFTPADLAGRMVQALDIREGTKVLEPSAGNGRLIWEALERGADVIAVEIDAQLCADLEREVRERMKPGDLLVINSDFLACASIPAPDVAIMNPPFSRNQDIAHVCHALCMLRPGGKMAAITSTHWTFAMDKPSREFRKLLDYPEPGSRVDDGFICGGEGMIEEAIVYQLPEGTFKESGTNVSALLILIEKAV